MQGFTGDLDRVSEALFSLKTNGGDEYCGQVIHEAVTRLPWKNAAGYKAIFICGNEPFTQGEFHYEKACGEAKRTGVIVNTVHCGSRDEGISGHWCRTAPFWAAGASSASTRTRRCRTVRCPQDEKDFGTEQKTQ